MAERDRAPSSRWRELSKGFFLPTLLALPGLLTYPLFDRYYRARWTTTANDADSWAILLAVGGAFLGSLALVVRWWRRIRWRAQGVIAGFFAAPLVLATLFFLWVVLFDVNLLPH